MDVNLDIRKNRRIIAWFLRNSSGRNNKLSQIQNLEQNIDELTLTSIDTKIIASLSTAKKKQIKARLGNVAAKLNEVIKKI